jgi:hypothetical protein
MKKIKLPLLTFLLCGLFVLTGCEEPLEETANGDATQDETTDGGSDSNTEEPADDNNGGDTNTEDPVTDGGGDGNTDDPGNEGDDGTTDDPVSDGGDGGDTETPSDGSEDPPSENEATDFTISGNMTGVQGTITLSLNGTEESFSGTAFSFTTRIAENDTYNIIFVTSSQQQICTITNGSGTVTSDVTSVMVSCQDQVVATGQPYLAFSDLVSGPDTGLNSGLGSGVVVTLWGQNLGTDMANGVVRFTDSSGQVHEPYVYYWKNADGVLPSGPANLYRSHRMQEIAFSVPDAADGLGEIRVTVDGETSNSLPFTIRPGAIFHVKSSGSDSTGDGSFDNPWLTADHALDEAIAGATLYIHDVNSGSSSSERGIYMNTSSASSTQEAQFAIASYPGFHPTVMGQRGFESYHVNGVVVSKLDFYSSDYTAVSATDQPTGSKIQSTSTYAIKSSRYGRAVANRITDIPGGCASGMQGAITGSAKWGNDLVSNYKIYGNEIYEYGCAGSNKLHHTTYMSIRSDGRDVQVEPWEFGWNYLHDNHAKFGIHQFDQNSDCGDPTGPIRIHHNVVVNQGGAGISIGSECWQVDAYIEDNILINVGLAADWDGIDPSTSNGAENGGISIRDSGLVGAMYINNNLIYRHTADGQTNGARGCLNLYGGGDNVSIEWHNNICYSDLDLPFVGAGHRAETKLDNIIGDNNVWHYTGLSPVEAMAPGWDVSAITADPLLSVSDSLVTLLETSATDNSVSSPLIDAATSTSFARDIYGKPRDMNPDIGPVEF